jgi:hypothetical protein
LFKFATLPDAHTSKKWRLARDDGMSEVRRLHPLPKGVVGELER